LLISFSVTHFIFSFVLMLISFLSCSYHFSVFSYLILSAHVISLVSHIFSQSLIFFLNYSHFLRCSFHDFSYAHIFSQLLISLFSHDYFLFCSDLFQLPICSYYQLIISFFSCPADLFQLVIPFPSWSYLFSVAHIISICLFPVTHIISYIIP